MGKQDKLHFRKDNSGKTACGVWIRPAGYTPCNSDPLYIMALWESDRYRVVCGRCVPSARARREKERQESLAGGEGRR